VCYDLNEKNKQREINGLLEAAKFYKLKSGLILTYSQSSDWEIDGISITMQPLWEWLIQARKNIQ